MCAGRPKEMTGIFLQGSFEHRLLNILYTSWSVGRVEMQNRDWHPLPSTAAILGCKVKRVQAFLTRTDDYVYHVESNQL